MSRERSALHWLGVWWHQSVPFDVLSAHLRDRGMNIPVRVVISAICALLALVALATIWSETGPRSGIQIAGAFVAGASAGGVLWASRWPTRAQAIGFAVGSNASIALVALAQSNPFAALLACTTFAAMASYVAMFHGAALLLYNFVVTDAIAVVVAARVAASHGWAAAVCGLTVVLILNLAVPVGIQLMVHALGADAVQAECDQLTGLLNRRAFRRRAQARVDEGADRADRLVVIVIDLDRFKQLNDQYGHQAGDDALVAVSLSLKSSLDKTAVIGRAGGEEFVVADYWPESDIDRRAQQLCDTVGALPFELTASVGVVIVAAKDRARVDARQLTELIAQADAAMYVAKRNGGNRVELHHLAPATI